MDRTSDKIVPVLTLLLFRIAWGFVGSTTARFSHFVRGPAAWFVYLRKFATGRPTYDVGHNPVGGIMVVVLIFAVLAQVPAQTFVLFSDAQPHHSLQDQQNHGCPDNREHDSCRNRDQSQLRQL